MTRLTFAISLLLASATLASGQAPHAANQPTSLAGDPPPATSVASSSPDRMVTLARRLSEQPPIASSPPIPPATAAATAPAATSVAVPGSASSDKESLPLGRTPTTARSRSLLPGSSGDGSDTPRSGSSSAWWLDTLTALGVVILLILLGRLVLQKVGGRRAAVTSSPVIEVLTRVSVAPRNHVLLLRLGGRILVVGDSGGGLRTLADIDDPEEVASLLAQVSAAQPGSISQTFNQLFRRADQDFEPRIAEREQGLDTAEFTVDRARDRVGGLLSRLRALSGQGGRP